MYKNLKNVKLYQNLDSRDYNENSQQSSIRFSFCIPLQSNDEEESFREVFPQVKCREYLGDVVVCSLAKIPLPLIYGFSLDEPINLNRYILSMSISDDKIESFIYNLEVLSKWERKQGLTPHKIYKVEETDVRGYPKVVVEFDTFWVSSPLLISIHTFFIRLGSYGITKTTLLSLIKECSKDCNDYFVSSTDRYISCLLLKLTNINSNFIETLRDITQANPITGCNDSDLLDFLNIYNLHDYEERVNLRSLYSDIPNDARFSIYFNHGQHGVYTWLHNIIDILKGEHLSNRINIIPVREYINSINTGRIKRKNIKLSNL